MTIVTDRRALIERGDADVSYGAHRLIVQYDHRFSDQLITRFAPSIGYDDVGFSLGNSMPFPNPPNS